jgi:RNA recognition motif-containing protein
MSNAIFCIKNGFFTLVADDVQPIRRSQTFSDLASLTLELPKIDEKIADSSSVSPTSSDISALSHTTSLCSSNLSEQSRKSDKQQAPWRKLKEFVTDNQIDSSNYTTIMIRNIPGKYTVHCLIEEIRLTGNECNFVHLPLSKKMDINLGYAFVNFLTPEMARDFLQAFQDYQFLKHPNSTKRAAVDYASMQGFEANVTFYAGRRIAGTKRAPWVRQ